MQTPTHIHVQYIVETADSLDTALEWLEEMVLKERKIDTLRRRDGIGSGSTAGRAGSTLSGVNPSPLALPRPMKPPEAPAPRVMEHYPREPDGHQEGRDNGGVSSALISASERVEAAAFLGHHENYYARAGSLRRKSSKNRRIAHAGRRQQGLDAMSWGISLPPFPPLSLWLSRAQRISLTPYLKTRDYVRAGFRSHVQFNNN